MSEKRLDRRLAAVLAADVVGYSRLMGADEAGTLEALKRHRLEVVDPTIAAHRGRIVKTTGDGMLVEFASAVDAVTCAMLVQDQMTKRNGDATPQITFRIGINVGDIIIDGDDIFGDGVNVAARLESECEPGSVYLSEDAFRQVRGKTLFAFEDVGERFLKNIDRPVRIYAVRTAGQRADASAAAVKAKPTVDTAKPLPLPDKPSIAVLPFQNMSGDPEQEYFADGTVEDIITALSRFRSLFVIARNSTFTYKGKAVDMIQVGRDLGVRYLLEGSVRKAGNRIRIAGQLIDASTGAHLWADRFDGAMDDIFELQDKVTQHVVGAIAPELDRAEVERASQRPTSSVDAVTEYYRGLPNVHFPISPERNDAAFAHFKRATSLDPGFVPAYAGSAACIVWRRANKWPRDNREDASQLLHYAGRVKELGTDDAFTLNMIGTALFYCNVDFEAGKEMVDRALRSNPNFAPAYVSRGFLRVWDGGSDLAIADFEHAMRLSPRDPFTFNAMMGLAYGYHNAGKYQEAAAWADRSLRAAPPSYLPGLKVAVYCYVAAGRLEDARGLMKDCVRLDPHWRHSNVSEWEWNGPRSPALRARMISAYLDAGLPE